MINQTQCPFMGPYSKHSTETVSAVLRQLPAGMNPECQMQNPYKSYLVSETDTETLPLVEQVLSFR